MINSYLYTGQEILAGLPVISRGTRKFWKWQTAKRVRWLVWEFYFTAGGHSDIWQWCRVSDRLGIEVSQEIQDAYKIEWCKQCKGPCQRKNIYGDEDE